MVKCSDVHFKVTFLLCLSRKKLTAVVSSRCGDIGHVALNCSKASETNCYNCGKAGHLAKDCTIEGTA